jgi:autotransporter-associated beta strand protein
MNTKRLTVACALLLALACRAGDTVYVTNLLEIASLDALGPEPDLVLGDATLRYTGPTDTLPFGYTLAPTNNGQNNAATLDITRPDTVLTVAGPVVAPAGSFIKTGEGTLVYAYPGYQELNKSRTIGNAEANPIVYDEKGSAGTNGYALFTVDKGRVVLGAPGQTNVITANAWVGSRTLASPRMDITGGVTRVQGTYFTIGRGTGTTASPQQPGVRVSDGAYLDLHSLVMGYHNSQPSFYSEPWLTVDGAAVRVQGDCFLSENASLLTTVTVTNGALFRCDSTARHRGMGISWTADARTTVNIGNASTGSTYQARVGRGGNLNVIQNSVFELDAAPTNAAQSANLGTVRFNAGTLRQRTAALSSEWFPTLTNLLVGAGGMILDVQSRAWLDPVPQADPASPGGSLTKTGPGTLAVRPNALAMQVDAGDIALAAATQLRTNGLSGSVTFGAGAALELAASGAAAGMALNLNGNALRFSPHSLLSTPDIWDYVGPNAVIRRTDGLVQLTPESGAYGAYSNQRGAAWLQRKKAVNLPWTATFSYTCWAIGTDPADGFSFVIHNDPRGTAALGGAAAHLGYQDSGAGRITNSVAFGVDVTGHTLRFGRQGTFTGSRGLSALLPKLAVQPVKTAVTVTWDGAGLLAIRVARPGSPEVYYAVPVNLPAEVGGNEGWIGFTAATGGRYGQHSISDFFFDNGAYTPVSYARYGGRLALGSGETLNAVLNAVPQQRGFVAGSLAYADDAVIAASVPEPPPAAPAPDLADQGMWKLNAAAHWMPDGRLATSTNAASSTGAITYGTAFTTNSYPIAGSWSARFEFDLGDTSSTPADYVCFVAQNATTNSTSVTPNPGFSMMWRYYVGGVTTTHLRMYTNNVMVQATADIAPVSLRYGGHTVMRLDYDADTRDLTVTTSQAAGTNVIVFAGVDLLAAVGSSHAYLGFGGGTGGLYAENLVSAFSFTPAVAPSAANGAYLAFDRLTGTGTLVKRGNSALGLLGDREQSTADLTLRLEEGGLLLRKNSAEPVGSDGATGDWIFSSPLLWGVDDTLKICAYQYMFTGTAMSTRRVRIDVPWTATFNLAIGRSTPQLADGFSFFFHNSPARLGLAAGTTAESGFNSIAKSFGLRWCFYPNHPDTFYYKVGIGRNGVWDNASSQSYLPAAITNGYLHAFTVRYDPAASTLTAVTARDGLIVTNVFTGINLPADVQDDHAYVGFGGGTGGSYQDLFVSDFRIAYDTPSDTTADLNYLAALTLPAASTNTVTLETSVPNATFRIASATVGDGAALGVASTRQPGTLAVGAVAQAGAAVYPVAAGCTLALTDLAGGTTLTKNGGGTLALTGAAATYTGDTRLAEGTLALDAPCLPNTTDLHVTSGATLHLGFAGKQYVHALFMDGSPMPGGLYTAANAPWITGPGALVVTYPPVGFLLLLK